MATDSADPGSILQLKNSLDTLFPFFIALNGIIFIIGVGVNSFVIVKIVSTFQMRHSRVLQFLMNAAICDLFKILFVLPITLANLLLNYFVFGPFLVSGVEKPHFFRGSFLPRQL